MNPFGPQGSNAATSLPPGSNVNRYGANDTWVKDCSANGRSDGTVLDAGFFNNIVGNLGYLVANSGIGSIIRGDMTLVYRAVSEMIAAASLTIQTALANYVQKTRKVSTTAPLQGGGQLVNDLTLSIDQTWLNNRYPRLDADGQVAVTQLPLTSSQGRNALASFNTTGTTWLSVIEAHLAANHADTQDLTNIAYTGVFWPKNGTAWTYVRTVLMANFSWTNTVADTNIAAVQAYAAINR